MLPYPSGDLHIGHWYAMTPADARARFMRMRGYNVLFPSASMPSACRRKMPPLNAVSIQRSGRIRISQHAKAAAFDGRHVRLAPRSRFGRPEYYKWTEWFFIHCTSTGWPIARCHRSISARIATPPWRASRSGVTTPLRALRHTCHQEGPGPVVLPHHQVRRRVAGLHQLGLA